VCAMATLHFQDAVLLCCTRSTVLLTVPQPSFVENAFLPSTMVYLPYTSIPHLTQTHRSNRRTSVQISNPFT